MRLRKIKLHVDPVVITYRRDPYQEPQTFVFSLDEVEDYKESWTILGLYIAIIFWCAVCPVMISWKIYRLQSAESRNCFIPIAMLFYLWSDNAWFYWFQINDALKDRAQTSGFYCMTVKNRNADTDRFLAVREV